MTLPNNASTPPLRSQFGIAALLVSAIEIIPTGGLILAAIGASLIANDPNHDAGGPLIILGSVAFTLVVAIAFVLVWLLGVVLACVGLARTDGRCWWSRFALINLVVLLIAGAWCASSLWKSAHPPAAPTPSHPTILPAV